MNPDDTRDYLAACLAYNRPAENREKKDLRYTLGIGCNF